ncbi:DgyrCDS11597 [Dimorphilus gyrociliatus]|uniref:alpha-1,6-mannosyl-glycoprotein 6-beta-N-acetylglucosaminyltransferase n=1 Tax=Dimorphilus gyrociliatus TaxID=2664684 RepID=A0A7I8W4S0_9ANNE|nr:DgyrCDS11597 [Dimorphilus gyrociliatus]
MITRTRLNSTSSDEDCILLFRRLCIRILRSRKLSICICGLVVFWVCSAFVLVPVGDSVNKYEKDIYHKTENIVLPKGSIIVNKTQLDRLLNRINELEQKLKEVPTSTKAPVTEKKDNHINADVSETSCDAPNDQSFPDCQAKISWMKIHWRSDKCYSEHGVDGTMCSFRKYLSEVEWFCPLLPGRKRFQSDDNQNVNKAKWNPDMEGLMQLLQEKGSRVTLGWIKQRIKGMWSKWQQAVNTFHNRTIEVGPRLKILLHLGLLTKQSNFKIAELQFKGGPLGELVQWADIISSLYVMGHNIQITTEVNQLQRALGGTSHASSCPPVPGRSSNEAEIIYTDIAGLKQLKKIIKGGYGQVRCKLRIVDSFGTEPAYNHEGYAKSHRQFKSAWAMHNLNPRQFFTMFPHSDDNSFMGFVVDMPVFSTPIPEKENIALVYGKHENYWGTKEKYLEVFKKYLDVHGTVFVPNPPSKIIPSWVQNHGLLKATDLMTLLQRSKVFVGLGFPYEGPNPLEAVAAGAIFIQPKFNPPHSSLNKPFFKGKPTSRALSSQHPYAEEFIGEPHVFTVDIDNKEELELTIKNALKAHEEKRVYPYLPKEFTPEGMIERLSAFLNHQDFCSPSRLRWPPDSSVQLLMSEKGQSCSEVCRKHKRICEASHFERLNTEQSLKNILGTSCRSVRREEDIFYPAFQPSSSVCILQRTPLLFSCVGAKHDLVRFCPCRDFISGQTALCSQCI